LIATLVTPAGTVNTFAGFVLLPQPGLVNVTEVANA
jgi:hypothetical protein